MNLCVINIYLGEVLLLILGLLLLACGLLLLCLGLLGRGLLCRGLLGRGLLTPLGLLLLFRLLSIPFCSSLRLLPDAVYNSFLPSFFSTDIILLLLLCVEDAELLLTLLDNPTNNNTT